MQLLLWRWRITKVSVKDEGHELRPERYLRVFGSRVAWCDKVKDMYN